MSGYAKLFSSITESSLWSEPKEVRLLFVTMLARADAVGFIEASIPGLARVANLTIEETESALAVLSGPDPYSKNPAHDGRRITKVDGGWCLINHDDYRNRRDEEDRREYIRNYMRDYRSRKQSVNFCKHDVNNVNHSKPRLTKAEAEAEAEAKVQTLGTTEAGCSQPNDDSQWIESLKQNPAYIGLDIPTEYSKMMAWCQVNHKKPTRRRFVNWLNRSERPLQASESLAGITTAGTQSKRLISNPERISLERQLAETRSKLRTIKDTYSGMQSWTEDDIEKSKVLADKIKELKSALGQS